MALDAVSTLASKQRYYGHSIMLHYLWIAQKLRNKFKVYSSTSHYICFARIEFGPSKRTSDVPQASNVQPITPDWHGYSHCYPCTHVSYPAASKSAVQCPRGWAMLVSTALSWHVHAVHLQLLDMQITFRAPQRRNMDMMPCASLIRMQGGVDQTPTGGRSHEEVNTCQLRF